jgi:hypothetical protein
MQMRAWIGIAVVVAIGLIWSVAAMSNWVPVISCGNEGGDVALMWMIKFRSSEVDPRTSHCEYPPPKSNP